ncbi:methyltransferase domain-containing protein [Methyloversatilis discipulorum]|jgi:SAM-dependent methyltransferase|uniref:methyltransferase domain-containing protein n=1 Tax=Methyloversatilis discipulorum TaxID=1119528 RepID=UPI000366DC01|nr:methyltransferase domain-containing protein [Methyloversatilis discipulorum]
MFSLDQQATDTAASELRALLAGMRDAFARGENAMEYARRALGRNDNLSAATLIAYDLQAGAYVRHALSDPAGKQRWCAQLAGLVAPHLPVGGSVMEVGSGEATTLAGLLETLPQRPAAALGFDISWSRCAHGRGWLRQKAQQAELFVADLFHIPLADASVDVVYTSHSLEPNGGRERAALQELLRVARRAVVLVEPIYELAGPEARERMAHHGYVRNLKATAEALGCTVADHRLLDFYVNPLNPSGVVSIVKTDAGEPARPAWRCPLTHAPLMRSESAFSSPDTGLVYPVLDGIPLLCRDHAVLASAYGACIES